MNGRTAFVVDGFNVYHSLLEASKSLHFPDERGTKWLNLRALCESYLPVFGSDAHLTSVFYFSALAHHLERSHPGITARHKLYAKVLEATGVVVEMGRFKKKRVTCHNCSARFMKHEEKETDVAVAVKVLEIFACDGADRVVLVTGDTDVAPVVRAARLMHPAREVCFAFPWNRKQSELTKLVPTHLTISREAYARYQFPDPVVVAGVSYTKPSSW